MIIGVEVELHSDMYNYQTIMDKEGLNTTKFTYINGLGIKMSREYYGSTIEYNFEPQKLTQVFLYKIRKFLQDQINKYNLRISCEGPGYVGTHIHIFDLKYRKIKNNKILETTMDFIDKEFPMLERNSRKRLALSHQLWGNYLHNHYYEYFEYCNDNGFDIYYRQLCQDRPKYNPFIVSNRSNKGKPRSVEIRIIPNEFLFNNKLYELLTLISKEKFISIDINNILYGWLQKI